MLLSGNELRFRLKHHEIGIEILGQAALVRLTSGKPRWNFRHPPRDIYQRESAAIGLRPHDRQRQREAGDSTPCRSKVSFVKPLHLRRTGRMIRGHQINDPLAESLPQFFAILPAADRRRALEQCLAVGDFLGSEM